MSTPAGPVIGVLHPGEMGAAVARCLTERGYTVLWASAGRTSDTTARAEAAGLTDAGDARELASRAHVIVSVCPPHAALDVARSVLGFSGLYVDANAISPGTARQVAELITGGGGRYVDGGIVGGPPVPPGGATRLYLSGADAQVVADLFAGTPLDARIAPGSLTAASAVKMAYASWTKGTAAMLLAARALARVEGVEEALLAEWALSQPRLAAQLDRSAQAAATKGWRWVGEMEEIAAGMAAAGLPGGFHQAAAEIFRRSPRLPAATSADGAADDGVTEEVLTGLAGGRPASQPAAAAGGNAGLPSPGEDQPAG